MGLRIADTNSYAVLFFRHDELISKKSKKSAPAPEITEDYTKFHAPLPTQQFGVSLQFIKDNNDGVVIPPIVSQCVRFLSQPDGKG